MKCDFCSAEPAVRAYRTPDFVIEEAQLGPGQHVQRISTEGWAACAECDRLIQAGDEEGIVDRSVDRLRSTNPGWRAIPRADARRAVAAMQQRFFIIRAAVPEECSEEPLGDAQGERK